MYLIFIKKIFNQKIHNDINKMEPHTKNIAWTGQTTVQNLPKPFHYDHFTLLSNGNVQGNGKDEQGKFSIHGSYTSNGEVIWSQIYPNNKLKKFSGMLLTNQIKGETTFQDGSKQPFMIEHQTERWYGFFDQNGQRIPMEFHMDVTDQLIYGCGRDTSGVFIIDGSFDPSSKKFQFSKCYLNCYSVKYMGAVEISGFNWVMNGSYEISGNSQGAFQLSKGGAGGGDIPITNIEIGQAQPFNPIHGQGFIVGEPVMPQHIMQQNFQHPGFFPNQNYQQIHNFGQINQVPIDQQQFVMNQFGGNFITHYDIYWGMTDDQKYDHINRCAQQGRKIQSAMLVQLIKLLKDHEYAYKICLSLQNGITDMNADNLELVLKSVKDFKDCKLRVLETLVHYTVDDSLEKKRRLVKCFVFGKEIAEAENILKI